MSIPSDFLIIGTDSGVGKTWVTCALLRDLRRRGFNAMGYKPICCGDRSEARVIREVTDPSVSLELINPVYLRANAEPRVAAELQRVSIDVQSLVDGFRKLKNAGYGPLIVEGIGGWETPLAPRYTMADLAQELRLPILLVAANRMGTASLAHMVTDAVAQRGLVCSGIILNQMSEEWDTAAVTNRQLIEDVTRCPVVAELIHGQDEIDTEAMPDAAPAFR